MFVQNSVHNETFDVFSLHKHRTKHTRIFRLIEKLSITFTRRTSPNKHNPACTQKNKAITENFQTPTHTLYPFHEDIHISHRKHLIPATYN